MGTHLVTPKSPPSRPSKCDARYCLNRSLGSGPGFHLRYQPRDPSSVLARMLAMPTSRANARNHSGGLAAFRRQWTTADLGSDRSVHVAKECVTPLHVAQAILSAPSRAQADGNWCELARQTEEPQSGSGIRAPRRVSRH